jgi:hypothetical protein
MASCPICERLRDEIRAAQLDLDNAATWLEIMNIQRDVKLSDRVLRIAAKIKLDVASPRVELCAHERDHSA